MTTRISKALDGTYTAQSRDTCASGAILTFQVYI